MLFGTTPTFLERLGLDSLEELPALSDFVPGPEVVEALETGMRAETSDRSEPTGTSDDLDGG